MSWPLVIDTPLQIGAGYASSWTLHAANLELEFHAKLDWQAGQSCGGGRVGQGQAKLYFLAELCEIFPLEEAAM